MQIQRTPLNALCTQAGGRMASFAGWEMPIQFSGLIQEHQAVRKKAGLFDISHMGIFEIEGENPKDNLQLLVPSDLHRIGVGEACYTVLLNESGGILDDLIIYDLGRNKKAKNSLLIVINAACTANDIDWLKKHLDMNKNQIVDAKKDSIFLAIQGPEACLILENYLQKSLSHVPRFGHIQLEIKNQKSEDSYLIFIARTGYTGEDGFEVLVPNKPGKKLWEELIKNGVQPCGLGARDSLRLEAAMHLYGNEMDSETTPFEAGLGWLVHLEMKAEFIGRKALEYQAEKGVQKRLVGLKLEGRAIARKGYQVFHLNSPIGKITSGTWSPTLGEGIALAYVPIELATIGNSLLVEIRGKKHKARVVKKPFYQRN